MKFNIPAWIQAGFRPEYGPQDNDTMMFLENLKEHPPGRVLEVGANDEASAQILTNIGFEVTGIDLLPDHKQKLEINYHRIVEDFVSWAERGPENQWDVIYSTSAIEHFGCPVYDTPVVDKDYDTKALQQMYRLLKPGGKCYLTVPYGKKYYYNDHWRIYDRISIWERLIGNFKLISKQFFLSGGCSCGHRDGRVDEEDADRYDSESHPHVTILLVLQKSARERMIIDEGMVGTLPEELLPSISPLS